MHIHVEGIEGCERRCEVRILGEKESGTGVGGVDVQPDVRGDFCDVCDFGEAVCCAGGCCAEGGGEEEGEEGLTGAGFEGGEEGGAGEGEVVGQVGGDGLVADAGDEGGFSDAAVAFFGAEGDEAGARVGDFVFLFLA